MVTGCSVLSSGALCLSCFSLGSCCRSLRPLLLSLDRTDWPLTSSFLRVSEFLLFLLFLLLRSSPRGLLGGTFFSSSLLSLAASAHLLTNGFLACAEEVISRFSEGSSGFLVAGLLDFLLSCASACCTSVGSVAHFEANPVIAAGNFAPFAKTLTDMKRARPAQAVPPAWRTLSAGATVTCYRYS